jgi:hypothetical protein
MAKGKIEPNWKQKVLEWQASGKTARDWSKQNNIPYTTFSGWKKRFKQAVPTIKKSSGFIELKDQSTCSGISLEYHGIKISLQQGFNESVLKQCLQCLGGISC